MHYLNSGTTVKITTLPALALQILEQQKNVITDVVITMVTGSRHVLIMTGHISSRVQTNIKHVLITAGSYQARLHPA